MKHSPDDPNIYSSENFMKTALIKLGLVSPAKESDGKHLAKTGEAGMSNMTPKSDKVDVAEPDGDGDDKDMKGDEKTWEWGYKRGNSYEEYPRGTGEYSYTGAQASKGLEESTFDVIMRVHKEGIVKS